MPIAANKSLDLIIGRSLIAAEVIASELRAKLLLSVGHQWLTEQELISRARMILSEYEPLLAENLLNADLAAWIEGYDRVAQKLPDWAQFQFSPWGRRPPNDPPKLPPLIGGGFAGDDGEELRFPLIEKAARSLFDRQILTPVEFNAASNRLKAESFTVARVANEDVLERIRDHLAETARDGASLDVFRNRLGPELEKSFIGPGHLENVYRTNLQTAFSQGHDELADHPIVDEIFPYQSYEAIHDRRARHEHLELEKYGLSGTNVYRKDDKEFWRLFNPPWDYQCRCGKILMTIDAAARKGVQEAAEWLRTGRRPPLESRLQFIPFRPKGSFAGVAA